jgi:hypothetical protein
MKSFRLGVLAVLLACGGNTPAPAVPAVAVQVPGAPALLANAPKLDLSPVREPKGMVAYASLGKPMNSSSFITNITGFPLGTQAATALGKAVLNDGALGESFELRKPVHAALTLDKEQALKMEYAVSIPLRDSSDATTLLAKRYSLHVDGGFTWLDPKEKPEKSLRTEPVENEEDREERDEPSDACAIMTSFEQASSLGAAGASKRLVCGGSRESVRNIGPYLVLGATRRTETKDFYFEGKLDAVKAQVTEGIDSLRLMTAWLSGKPGAGFIPFMGTALREFGTLATEDLAKATIELELGNSMMGSMTLGLKGKSSALARVMTSRSADGPAPAAFFKLPIDSQVATYRKGFDEKELEEIAQDLLKGLDVELASRKASSNDAKQAEELLSSLIHFYAQPMVTSAGFDPSLPLGKNQWGLSRVEIPFTEVSKVWALGDSVLNRNAAVAKVMTDLRKAFSGFSYSAKKTSVAGFPKSIAYDVVVTMPDKTKGKTNPTKATHTFMIAVPQDSGTLVATGTTAELAAKRLKIALDGTEEKTLAKRSDIDVLRTTKASSGGFLEPRMFWQVEEMAKLIPENARGILSDPKLGVSPMFFYGNGDKATQSVSLEVGKPVLDDAKRIIIHFAK